MKKTQVNFRNPPSPLVERQGAHGLGWAAKRDLERYYEALEEEMPRFEEAQARYVLDALHHIDVEPSLVWAAVQVYARTHPPACDLEPLGEQLQDLTWCQAQALVDATERWLLTPEEGRTTEKLRDLGLIR